MKHVKDVQKTFFEMSYQEWTKSHVPVCTCGIANGKRFTKDGEEITVHHTAYHADDCVVKQAYKLWHEEGAKKWQQLKSSGV